MIIRNPYSFVAKHHRIINLLLIIPMIYLIFKFFSMLFFCPKKILLKNSIVPISIIIFIAYFHKSFKFIIATFTLSPITLYSLRYKNIQEVMPLVYLYKLYSYIIT